jgi:NADH dehydrogenase
LKTIEEALEIRQRVFSAFEKAEREVDPFVRQQLMTFVVVGGGPTGIELAGAIGELAQHTLRRDFRSIDTADARVVLLEGASRILPTYPADLSRSAEASLRSLGVTVRTNTLVTDIHTDFVVTQSDDHEDRIPSRTVVWAAGVKASSLGGLLGEATGADVDRQGRVHVEPDLSLHNHPEIFVLGDLAHARDRNGAPLPGVAPVAIQQGRYVAKQIRQRLRSKIMGPFRYTDRGSMAVIGRSSAVAQIGRLHLRGPIAWLAWLFIHLVHLVEYENRLLVLVQWGWNYVTRNRSARLITNERNSGLPCETGERAEQPSATIAT